jgi:hypothetical protein
MLIYKMVRRRTARKSVRRSGRVARKSAKRSVRRSVRRASKRTRINSRKNVRKSGAKRIRRTSKVMKGGGEMTSRDGKNWCVIYDGVNSTDFADYLRDEGIGDREVKVWGKKTWAEIFDGEIDYC